MQPLFVGNQVENRATTGRTVKLNSECKLTYNNNQCVDKLYLQRWSRGHKARGQGQLFRGQTLSRPRTQAQVLSKKKRSSQKFFRRSPQKNVFQKIFQTLLKILTNQKIVLSSSRGQANFRGLEASRPRPRVWTFKAKDFKMCPRGQGRPRELHLCLSVVIVLR